MAKLSEMSPWEIATHYGIGYNGDMNPIEHGGYFYSLADWEDNDYAACVEFWEDPETGALVVQPGTIHNRELESAFQCIGVGKDDPLRDNVHCQIDACRSYSGIEPNGTSYPDLKVFNLDTWKEQNIWESIRGWIEELAN